MDPSEDAGSMADRGVTRPMHAEHDEHAEHGEHDEHDDHAEHDDHDENHHAAHETHPAMASDEDRRERLAHEHHERTLWIPWLLILLGFWVLVAPATFLGGGDLVEPAGGRELWLDQGARITALRWSDLISGALLVLLGWRALTPDRPITRWAACGVGVWLSLAPLLFWSPSAAIYLNDTLVGALVIALTVLIPGMPNMIRYMAMGPDKPPGWSYNPSSWPQRSLMIGLGFAGWLVSRALATYQLGYVDTVWEPLFGEGSRLVLTSEMSRSLPISDAALGAFAYTFEFLMGWMGGEERWRTMPWMVTFFGILVIPLGLVHVFLVASQPIVVGEWCTLCLLAAAIMLPMIPLEVDEVIAMGQFLRRSKREGKSLWSTFWRGGMVEGVTAEESQPAIAAAAERPTAVLAASVRGLSSPWTLLVCAAIGAWWMGAPAVIDAGERLADLERGLGAVVVTLAVLALGEPLRALRLLQIPLALALIVAVWALDGGVAQGVMVTVSGAALVGLSLPRGPQKERYGGWDRWIR